MRKKSHDNKNTTKAVFLGAGSYDLIDGKTTMLAYTYTEDGKYKLKESRKKHVKESTFDTIESLSEYVGKLKWEN